MSSPNRFCAWTMPLVALGCLLMVFVAPHGPQEHAAIGLLLGTLFAHATLASAWTALGPFPLIWRLPLSLVWLALLLLAMFFNRSVNDDDITIVMAGCLFGQWLLLQLPLWGLSLLYQLRLRSPEEVNQPTDPRTRQFGIRELMIFTGIVGVALGVGRAVVIAAAPFQGVVWRDAPIFISLGVAAIVMTLPLLLAALLPHWAAPATLGILVLIGLATIWELPLLYRFISGPGPNRWHLIWINAVTAAWIPLFAWAVRRSGYRLA